MKIMKMKKLLIAALFLGTALGLFAQQGIIKDLYGTVELKPAGSTTFPPAKVGDRIAPNTIVSTSFRSTAIISIGSTTLLVQPITRLSLTDIQQSQEQERLNVNLQTGRVRVEVHPPVGTRTNTSVTSPTATASVRGTEFEVDTTTITVYDGTVAYSGTNGKVILVPAGESSRIDPLNGRALDPLDTAAADLRPRSPAGVDRTIVAPQPSDIAQGTQAVPEAPGTDFVINLGY
jgi:hypothetical protein